MEKIQQVTDMPIYQSFFQLALDVEMVTRNFGPDFRWLRNQALRSSESVCANMTEGFYSQYSTEYLQALYRCRREARETVTRLCYGRDVNQISSTSAQEILEAYDRALTQLSLLIGSIERKIRDRGKGKDNSLVVKDSTSDYLSVSDVSEEPLH